MLKITKKPSLTAKGNPVSKKRRSAAQRAATAKMLAANRARRSGKRKARKAHKAKRATRVSRVRRVRRSKRRARAVVVAINPVRRRKRRASRVKARRVRRKVRAVKRRSRRRGRRSVRVNPAISLKGFIQPITNVVKNLKDSFSSIGGALGFVGGAVGTVAGGTLLARGIMPIAMKLIPGVAAHPIGARVISATLYYSSGWLLAKFLPVNDKIKRGILAGSVVAAITEVIRPGTVQQTIAMIPGVGPLIAGNLGGIEPELGEYLERAMAGLGGQNAMYGGAAYALGDTTFGEYNLAGLGDTTFGEYSEAGGVDGLGCAPAAQELVSYDEN